MKNKYILSIDQGTTGTKVILLNQEAKIHAWSYQKHNQYYPKPGWAEHNPEEIWRKIQTGIETVLSEGGVTPKEIEAVGLANQGETVMFWDSDDGRPLYPAVLWSCRRSQEISENWREEENWNEKVNRKTGLHIDPYFSATKIRWMMENIESVQEAIQLNVARCSTLDSWLIWKMTGGESFLTDSSTAARTLLYNIYSEEWDQEIMDYLQIERDWLPSVEPTVGFFGTTNPSVFCGIEAPIRVSMVDQPAALYGHLCIEPGSSKCTFGTGCFVYMNVGEDVRPADNKNLMSTIVWKKNNRVNYAYDGAIYSAGSAIEWGINSMNLYPGVEELQSASETWYEQLKHNESSDVWFVPALSGMATPYWDSDIRGGFVGISHNTSKEDMAKSILEGIAHRVADVLEEMNKVSSRPLKSLKVDGRLTENPYLMQFQANILGIPVEVPSTVETTGVGLGYLVGEALNWWIPEALKESNLIESKIYYPKMNNHNKEVVRKHWKKIVHGLQGIHKEGGKSTAMLT
ncbi:glycerol kinase GlpK [Alkalihalobacillus oceani]|uniref:FGGY-family carbohydrate kinase n=1 Tax=Halalkalibacter oceani TaxID=1653776 RepID=UPI00203CF17F|nr:glycerol kinase GlpK [Halalkalibacter oceani]MCM3761102.1 glycerol kinase GlpK [Halalkalibacter oceani]